MSFLIDPVLLVVCGALIVWLRNRLLYRVTRHATKVIGFIVVVLFWVIAGSLYLNFGWFDWLWLWTGRALNGRDFMINSGVFHFEYVYTTGLIDTIALMLFALYPLWLYFGVFLGYLLFGRHERQTGMVGLL
ncbi:MAG: hypothetical protein Q6361_04865 [Candidatus Hermodarchaeota archaeon]|nr:hypothetical protein [Candidatus Hermodarchaeota archaeon]